MEECIRPIDNGPLIWQFGKTATDPALIAKATFSRDSPAATPEEVVSHCPHRHRRGTSW